MLLQPWKIRLLGALELDRGEVRITHFPTEKVGFLLAYLAAHSSETHTRDELIDLFWPDSTPDAGRVSLRQALASLRRLLEPPDVPAGTVLFANRTHVGLHPDAIEADVIRWNRLLLAANKAGNAHSLKERLGKLDEAVASYGGAFLPGAYMDWALTERQYRQEQFLETLVELAEAQSQAGNPEGAIATIQLLLRTDPLHEEANAQLMRLYALQGKQGQARQQYVKLSRLLRDELGIDPSPEIRALYFELDQIPKQRSDDFRVPTIGSVEIPPPAAPLIASNKPDISPRLPLRLTRFFGREDELHQISNWLQEPEVRLITLSGMGGVGKTRLALQAAQQKTRFGASVTFVPLSDTQDPEQLLPAILHAMGMPAVAASDPLARLLVVMGAQPHLLILDNFEQIAESAAETLWRLLEEAPSVACLVTSRQALNLPGEYELCLTPFPVPEAHLLPQEMITNPTVQMLVDRMRGRRPDFQVTPANAASVASLCSRLEGIPLAVELAAGWARDLTINQMQERLEHRFDLLVSRQHGVPPRHQSLRAAVESSYQLLSPPLQRFFLKLSVFRSGWRDEMAVIACDEGRSSAAAVSDNLRALREHSLITAQEAGEYVRYGMLETLRAFGKEMLSAEIAHEVASLHALWLLKFASDTSPKLHRRDQAYWLDRMEEEQDNFRGALEFSAGNDPLLGLRLANALYWFWYVRSYYTEGEQWISMLVERAEEAPTSDRAWGLLPGGHLANCQSNNQLAVSRYKVALALFEEIGDARGAAHAVARLGNAAQELRDIATGYMLCAEGVTRFRKLQDPSGLLLALFYYLNTLLEVDNPEEGEACFEEAHAIAESQGDLRFQSLLQFCFSGFRRRWGDIAGALESYRAALGLQILLREPLSVSYILRDLSHIALTQGNPPLAIKLYGAMRGLRRRIGYPLGKHEEEWANELEVRLHACVGEAEYLAMFDTGLKLDFDSCLLLAVDAAGSKGGREDGEEGR